MPNLSNNTSTGRKSGQTRWTERQYDFHESRYSWTFLSWADTVGQKSLDSIVYSFPWYLNERELRRKEEKKEKKGRKKATHTRVPKILPCQQHTRDNFKKDNNFSDLWYMPAHHSWTRTRRYSLDNCRSDGDDPVGSCNHRGMHPNVFYRGQLEPWRPTVDRTD